MTIPNVKITEVAYVEPDDAPFYLIDRRDAVHAVSENAMGAFQTNEKYLKVLDAIRDIPAIAKLDVEYEEIENEQQHDAVSHPSHYCKGGVECLDAIKAALGDKYEGFLAGNVLKYVYRYPDKNGVEDCKKAAFYLQKLIELKEGAENGND